MLQVKIPVHQVAKGMYVAKLDRPWLETPFPFQGFLIERESQLRKLHEHCKFVFIDVNKGLGPPAADPWRNERGMRGIPPAPLPRPVVDYPTESTISDEIAIAKQVRAELVAAVDGLFQAIDGEQPLDLTAINYTVAEMERSILRNPDAFLLLNQFQRDDRYTYCHAIQCSAYAIAFGRQLGLPQDQIHELALGCLLFDVGKSKLPKQLLDKGTLTPTEFETIKTHVTHSTEIMQGTPGIGPRTIALISNHHERFDGSGYPQGLRGGEISLFARMAAIVDFFDAVTSERTYAVRISPHEAIKMLYDFRNTLFQDELIEQFIQTLGVYPIGTLVELSNGEVGLVEGQNKTRRLRPRILILLSEDKQELSSPFIRDLMQELETSEGTPLHVTKCLDPGTHGIQPNDYYL